MDGRGILAIDFATIYKNEGHFDADYRGDLFMVDVM
jgi:hypothetical protein